MIRILRSLTLISEKGYVGCLDAEVPQKTSESVNQQGAQNSLLLLSLKRDHWPSFTMAKDKV